MPYYFVKISFQLINKLNNGYIIKPIIIKDARMKHRFGFNRFLVFTCPPPNNNGASAFAEATNTPIPDEILIRIANNGKLILPIDAANGTARLKKSTWVTEFEMKLVNMIAPIAVMSTNT